MKITSQKAISLLLRHPEFAKTLLCQNYTFTESELLKYQNVLDWGWISGNNSINWTEDLIHRYKSKLDWDFFSANAVAFSNIKLLDKFMEDIDWKGTNSGLIFSSSIAMNEHVQWSAELMEKYRYKVNFNHLSNNEKLPWSEQLIEMFEDRWNWEGIASNSSVPWTLKLVDKYADKIEFTSNWVVFNLSATDQLDLIEKYSKQLNWRVICSNSKLHWIEENLLKRWKSKLNWYGLASNELLNTDSSFFENNLEKWLADPFNFFGIFSRNYALPWSAEFIDRFIDFWDWEWLCMNKGVQWDNELIGRYIDKVEWGGREYFPDNSFRVKGGFISNENLDWSIDLILRFENYIDFEELFNVAVWDKAFKPYINGESIFMVLDVS